MSAVKILLVEDNPDEEELALIAFERSGVPAKKYLSPVMDRRRSTI